MSAHYGSIEEGRGNGGKEFEVSRQDSTDSTGDAKYNHHRAFLKRRWVQVSIAAFLGAVIFFSMAPRRPSYHYKRVAPDEPLFFHDQLVDHNDESAGKYSQRYYESTDHFKGPGHPIFIILGGEDELDQILYPFISDTLGRRFGAYTVNPEHRFYGESQPVANPTNEDLRELLTPAQALNDFVRLLRHKQAEFGCGPRGTPEYCPVMSVGASYPGFLAVLMRIDHSEVVDIGYGSSAPLNLYSHRTSQYAYFEKVTEVADRASPGCADAVRDTLMDVRESILRTRDSTEDLASLAADLGVCTVSIPDYIDTAELFAQELFMIIAAHFAEDNMGYYPPTPDQDLIQGCKIFQDTKKDAMGRVSAFLRRREGFEKCFDMKSELPPGPHGTISASDWSGTGDGNSGLMWDFQGCDLIQECGMSEKSMFVPRDWSLDWLTSHCEDRFGVTPDPKELRRQFHFEDLSKQTRILFTNGLSDGWSAASITVESDHFKVVNMPNGAHHSDLTHNGPSDADTPDIKDAHVRITKIVSDWLDETREEYKEYK